jgi:hypothetical protein
MLDVAHHRAAIIRPQRREFHRRAAGSSWAIIAGNVTAATIKDNREPDSRCFATPSFYVHDSTLYLRLAPLQERSIVLDLVTNQSWWGRQAVRLWDEGVRF